MEFATEQAINAIKTATIQHTIVQNTLSYPTPSTQTQNTTTPMYGTVKTYGEYNDDGMIGHNGGDTQSALANIWLDWQHATDDITPNDLKSFDSKYDIATFGLSGHNKQTKHSTYNWTFYSGYINGTSKNSELHSAEHGGFIGICGELASDLSLTELFLRMGIDELSVSPRSILSLRDTIRKIDLRI